MGFVAGAFATVFGLVIGSFLNVCIYRLPIKETIVTGRSHCMACGAAIRWYDLIPVLSFLILKGRCRSCGGRISPRYPIIELANAVLYLMVVSVYGLTPDALICAAAASALLVIAMIDIDTMEIPNGIIVFILVIGCIALFFSHNTPIYERIIGLFAVSLPLMIAALISKGGMGGGDIKLAAAAGLLLGYKAALLSLLLASLTGAVFGVVFARVKGVSLKTAIPFGPFLCAGFVFSMLYGAPLLSWYLSLFRHA